MSIITFTSLVILVLSLKKLVDISAKYEKMTDKIKSLERQTNGTKKNTQAQTKKFTAEVTTALHYVTEEELLNVIRKPPLIYSVTIQEQPPDDRHPEGYLEVKSDSIEMLNFKRFKEAIASCGMHSSFVRMLN